MNVAATASVTAYFPSLPDCEQVRAALHDALRIYGLPSSAVPECGCARLENQDWLAEWKKSWQPVEVGASSCAAVGGSPRRRSHSDSH